MKIFVALTIIAIFSSPSLGINEEQPQVVDEALARAARPPVCPANSAYTTCGTACPKTCKNKDMMIKCIALCKVGCQCKAGYVLNDQGRCILPRDCPRPSCPKNQVYSECGANGCQNTCAWPDLGLTCKAPCKAGCVCKEGYLRDASGNCVLAKSCPVIATTPTPAACPFAHESYTDCGTACPLTCENKDNPPIFCTANCVPGCFCESGYVRGPNGDCILPAACPPPQPTCPANEVYSLCDANSCQRSCMWLTQPLACRPICTPGCVCVTGLIRDDATGACIPPSSCPP